MVLPRLILCLSFLVTLSSSWANEPLRDVKYDTKHERNVLDFWPALEKGDSPNPVYVWFHGGGFKNGDKSQLENRMKSTIETYRSAGYAVISCNYPFLADDMDYRDIVDHCAHAIQFIRSKSDEWHIDKKRLVCGGVSAGALISEFLGYYDDLAKPESKDLILRQSSRPQVVVSVLQPVGTREFALRYMDKGEAPVFIYSNASPSDRVHPPAAAIMLRDKAKSLQIPCVLFGGGRNELPTVPKDKKWLELQLDFCNKHLNKSDKATD